MIGGEGTRPRVVVVLPAYNAAETLERTVRDIPQGAADLVVLVDDASDDATVEVARRLGIRTEVHASNRGYGGNQKTCYRLALEAGADVVVMLHPDYQYDPARIPDLVAPLAAGTHDVMLGSRVLDGGALAGGMPIWKYVGNRVLTWVQNRLLGLRLSEFHTGYRAFTADALRAVPFDRNAEGFRFDAQMLTQLRHHGMRIGEIASPARYLADSSSVGFGGSVRYGVGCITAALRYRLHRAGLAPAGWLGRPPHAAADRWRAPAIAALVVLSALARLTLGVEWRSPLRMFDSFGYSFPSNGVDLVSFIGYQPRSWPVPLFYSLFDDDVARTLAQVIVGTAAWSCLAVIASRRATDARVAVALAAGVLLLGTTPQVVGWDRLIMSESLTVTLSVVAIALALLPGPMTRERAVLIGSVAITLAFVRYTIAPLVVLVAIAAGVRAVRRRSVAPAILAGMLAAGIAWIAIVIPRQEQVFPRFAMAVWRVPLATYDRENFGTLLWSRLWLDDRTNAWLERLDAPPMEPDLFPDPQLVGDPNWGIFASRWALRDDWARWFEGQGGLLSLAIRAPLAEPVAHLGFLARDLPVLLSSIWPDPDNTGYGPPVMQGWPGTVLFFSRLGDGGPRNVDLAVLVVAWAVVAVRARRGGAPWSDLERAAALLVGASVVGFGVVWLLNAVEQMRHMVPVPIVLRLALLLGLAGAADALRTARGAVRSAGMSGGARPPG